MADTPINVHVVKYKGRSHLMMRYVDPVTGRQRARSTKTADRRTAERRAAKWEAELAEGRYHRPSGISWTEFRDRYDAENLSSLAVKTAQTANVSLDHLQRLIEPHKLAAIDADVLSKFQAALRATGIREASIACYLRHVRAALGWAASIGLIARVPKVQLPKRVRGRKLMRGRPVTTEEFERLLTAVPAVRPHDSPAWIRYLRGLWLSGLRLEESLICSWDDEAGISIDFRGRHPRFRIFAEAEKGHQDRLLPLTPDFAEFLWETPEADREGVVFPLLGLQTGRTISGKRVSRIVSAIGRQAGIFVNRAEQKYASAHDLRRSFGTRWAQRVKPATLQLLMRHRSIETTLAYYVESDADDVADELWGDYRGNLSGQAAAARIR